MDKEKIANETGLMEKIVSLAKRRGFVFPGSEIYGGLGATRMNMARLALN